MITKKFARKVNYAFQKLNYFEKDNFDIIKFHQAAFKSITNALDFDDAYDALISLRFVFKKVKKIGKMFKKKRNLVENFKYTGKPFENKEKDKDVKGILYFTDGIFKKEITFLTNSNELIVFNFIKEGSCYKMYSESEYSFKLDSWNSEKALIYKNDKLLCEFIYNGSTDTYKFKNNSSDYDLIMFNEVIDIYEKEYMEEVNFIVDREKCICVIGSLFDKAGFGMSIMCCTASIKCQGDFEFLAIIAVLSFLLKKRFYIIMVGMAMSSISRNILFQSNIRNINRW